MRKFVGRLNVGPMDNLSKIFMVKGQRQGLEIDQDSRGFMDNWTSVIFFKLVFEKGRVESDGLAVFFFFFLEKSMD